MNVGLKAFFCFPAFPVIMGTLRDDHREVRPPTYTDVVNSTRYPILRPRLSSEPSIDMEATEQTLVIPAVGLMIPPPGGVRLPLPEQAGPSWRLRFVDFTPHLPPGGCSQKRSLNNFKYFTHVSNCSFKTNIFNIILQSACISCEYVASKQWRCSGLLLRNCDVVGE